MHVEYRHGLCGLFDMQLSIACNRGGSRGRNHGVKLRTPGQRRSFHRQIQRLTSFCFIYDHEEPLL